MPTATRVIDRLSDLAGDTLLTSVAQGDLLYRGATKWNNLAVGAAGTVLIGGTAPVWSGSPTISGSISVGTNPAGSGAVRLANAAWLTARNAANSADLNLLRANSSNQAEITPNLSLLNGAIFTNNDGIQLKDASGTGHYSLWMDAGNHVLVGSVDAPSPTGNTYLYASGTLAATLTPAGLVQVGSGDDVFNSYTGVGSRLNVQKGTAGAPDTTLLPLGKFSRTISVTEAALEAATANGADGADLLAALIGSAVGTAACEVQPIGVMAYAATASTAAGGDAGGNDACGLYAVGRVTGSGTGFAIGGLLVGERYNNTATMTAAEIYNGNLGSADSAWSSTGASSSGIWLNVFGNNDSGAGINFGNAFGRQWENGIAFTAQVNNSKTGGVRVASIRDAGSATTSLLIQGAHSTAAIGIADGSGRVGIGTVSPAAALHVATTMTDPAASGVILSPQMNLTTTGKSGVSCNSVFYPTAAIGLIYGMQFIPFIYGDEGNASRTITDLTGIFSQVATHSGFDSGITSVYNYRAQGADHSGGGTITNLVGYYADISTGQARVTNPWQFYASGNAPSYFGGPVRIAASARLNFAGQAGDVSSPVAGDMWYDTTAKGLRTQATLGPISQGGLIYANTADDALASGGTAQLKFASQIALAAAGLTVGKVIRVRLRGTYTTDSTAAQTITINIKLGDATNATSGTTVATTVLPATLSLTNANWSVECEMVIRSATTAWGAGFGTVGSTVAAPWTSAVTSVSNGGGVGTVTTIPNISTVHTVHATGTPNDTGMTITLRNMTVEILN